MRMTVIVLLLVSLHLCATAPVDPTLHKPEIADEDTEEDIVSKENVEVGFEVHYHDKNMSDQNVNRKGKFTFSFGDVTGDIKFGTMITNNEAPIPTDGGWSGWSEFGPCSATCGVATKKRTRTCYGGAGCPGANEEIVDCTLSDCAIDGGWTSFGACTKTCEGGVQRRTCTNPIPQHGGKHCLGEADQPCNEGVECTPGMSQEDILNIKINKIDENVKAIVELTEALENIEDGLKALVSTRKKRSYDEQSGDEMKLLELLDQVYDLIKKCGSGTHCDSNKIKDITQQVTSTFKKVEETGTVSDMFKNSFYEKKEKIDTAISAAIETQGEEKDKALTALALAVSQGDFCGDKSCFIKCGSDEKCVEDDSIECFRAPCCSRFSCTALDLCTGKRCGEQCDTSLGLLQVVRYCQPDGSCGTNARPRCTENPCSSGRPLTDPSGVQLFCGRGPKRVECPRGSSCRVHPTDRYAVCCPKEAPKQEGESCFAGDCAEGLTCERDERSPDAPGICTRPVDGVWSAWGDFESCSVTCGDGTRRRTRTCSSPAQANGGNDCSGSSQDTQVCNDGDCPDACLQIFAVVGTCKASIPSWSYNQATGRCEPFTYGGCRGNDNRFSTHQECSDRCKTSGNIIKKDCNSVYTKDNLSFGEYQMKITLPQSDIPKNVEITFDAPATLGSCHSNCQGDAPSGEATHWSVTYTGSEPLQIYNVKKVNPDGNDDRVNIVTINVNGQQICGTSQETTRAPTTLPTTMATTTMPSTQTATTMETSTTAATTMASTTTAATMMTAITTQGTSQETTRAPTTSPTMMAATTAVATTMAGAQVCAVLYEHSEYTGSSINLYTEFSNLIDIGWNDRISSIRIEEGNKLNAFEHINFEGEKLIINSDTILVNPNNWISSLRCSGPNVGTSTMPGTEGFSLLGGFSQENTMAPTVSLTMMPSTKTTATTMETKIATTAATTMETSTTAATTMASTKSAATTMTANGHRVTVTAKFWFVSDYEGGEAAAKETAAKYVAATNEALKNSEVPIDYLLWGTVEELPRTNDDINQDHTVACKFEGTDSTNRRFLNALGDDSDSRNYLKQSADHLVLMFNNLGGLGGRCCVFGPWESGITQTYCTIIVTGSEVTFAHEAGHCMGAMHNREAHEGGNDEDYNYGYCLPDKPYATVMSYTSTCPDPSREMILYYSNPEVDYDGVPTGTEKDNNARAMTEARNDTAGQGNNCMDGRGNTDNLCVFAAVPEEFSDWSECCCESRDECGWMKDDSGSWVNLLEKQTRSKTRECTNLLGEPVYYKYCLAERGGAAAELPEDYQIQEIADCECSARTEAATEEPTEAPTEVSTQATAPATSLTSMAATTTAAATTMEATTTATSPFFQFMYVHPNDK